MAKKMKKMKEKMPARGGFKQGAGPMNLVGPGKDRGKFPNAKKPGARGK